MSNEGRGECAPDSTNKRRLLHRLVRGRKGSESASEEIPVPESQEPRDFPSPHNRPLPRRVVVFRRHLAEGKERIRKRPRSNRSVTEPRVAHCSVLGTPALTAELDER